MTMNWTHVNFVYATTIFEVHESADDDSCIVLEYNSNLDNDATTNQYHQQNTTE